MPNEVVAGLLVSIDANTVKLRTEMDRAKASTRAAGQQMKADMTEARGAIKLASEEIGLNLNRHLTSFLAKLPGVAPLMSAAFSATAVVGIGMAIFEAGKKLAEYYEKAKKAQREAATATKDFLGSLHSANLEHEVALAKMDEEIAKLEHRPGDALKRALAEARAEAFKLSEELRRAVDQERKLLEEHYSANFFERALGAAGSKDTLDAMDRYEEGAERIAKIEDPTERTGKLKSYTAAKLDALHEEISARTRLRALLIQAQGRGLGPGGSDEMGRLKERFGYGIDPKGQDKILAGLSSFHDMVQDQYQRAADDEEDIRKRATLGIDKHNEEAARLAKEALEKLKRDAEERLRVMENELARQQELMAAQGQTMGASQERDFWKSKMYQGTNLGNPINAMIQDKIGPLSQRALVESKNELRQWIEMMGELNKEADKKSNSENPFFGDAAENRNASEGMAAGIRALHDRPELLREIAGAQDELNAKQAVESGRMRQGQEEIVAQANAVARLKNELNELQGRRAAALLMPATARKPEDNPEMLSNQILDIQGKLGMATSSLNYLQQQQTFSSQMGTMFSDWINRVTDLKSVAGGFFENVIGAFNDEAVRLMTTQYHRGDWKNAMKPAFTGLAKSGLEGAEGALLKGLGGGKLGTRANPMYVQFASGLPAAVGGSALSSANSAGGFLGFLGGVGKFFGFMESGGVMSPGGWYLTGEKGPELVNVGSTSRVHNARDTSKMLGGGSGGHTFNIDARGATDPAAVRRQVHEGIMAAAPHIAAGAIRADQERQARRPNMRS